MSSVEQLKSELKLDIVHLLNAVEMCGTNDENFHVRIIRDKIRKTTNELLVITSLKHFPKGAIDLCTIWIGGDVIRFEMWNTCGFRLLL